MLHANVKQPWLVNTDLIAKISCDVSVNECQSNNTKDITRLMIDRTRKAQGLLQNK